MEFAFTDQVSQWLAFAATLRQLREGLGSPLPAISSSKLAGSRS
jgi:hypothetical protein